jgi:oligoendopeptidase F
MTEWKLKDLYENEDILEKESQKTQELADRFETRYKKSLKKLKPSNFLKALQEYEQILQSSAKMLTYAFLKFAKNSDNGAFYAKYQEICNKISEKLLFFELEFNKLPKKRQDILIKNAGIYSFYLESLQKQKPYQLSAEEERVLLKKDLTSSSAFSRLFDEHFSRLEFKFDKKRLSEEQMLSLLHSSDRQTRKKAAATFSKELKKHIPLLTFIFNMIKTDQKSECELRGYAMPETPRHLDNKISQKSVDALIATTEKNFSLVSDYYEIKAKLLGIKKLKDYDRYAPIEKSKKRYDFEKSKKIVLEAFGEFNPQFADIAKKALDEGWCDVYPKNKKRGGAFSHPATPDTHPFVLLNHTNRRRDLFTLAHELGHAVHQYLSKDVGYLCADTPLTTSETASVFAEMLVFDYIKKDAKKEELISLYASKLEDIFATLFRQVIFTTFERRVHAHEGELDSKTFNSYWLEENKKMFGKSVKLTKDYRYWWSYIPHFIHSPFYCYAYSYGQLLVLALYGLYKGDYDNFVEKYTKFLSSGGSKSPKELIEKFGFDIDKEEFWQIGIDEIESILSEFKRLSDVA